MTKKQYECLKEVLIEDSLWAKIFKTIYIIYHIKSEYGLIRKVYLSEIAYVLWKSHYEENKGFDEVSRILWSYVYGRRGQKILDGVKISLTSFIRPKKERKRVFLEVSPYVCLDEEKISIADIIIESDFRFFVDVVTLIMNYSLIMHAAMLDFAKILSVTKRTVEFVSSNIRYELPILSPRDILEKVNELSRYLKNRLKAVAINAENLYSYTNRLIKILNTQSKDLIIQAMRYEVTSMANKLETLEKILKIKVPPISFLALLTSFIFYGSIYMNIDIIKRYLEQLEIVFKSNLGMMRRVVLRLIDTVERFLLSNTKIDDLVYAILMSPEKQKINFDDPGIIIWFYALIEDLPKYATELQIPISKNIDVLEDTLTRNLRTLQLLQKVENLIDKETKSNTRKLLKRKIEESKNVLLIRILVLYLYLRFIGVKQKLELSKETIHLFESLRNKGITKLLNCIINNDMECVRSMIKEKKLRKFLKGLIKFWGKQQDSSEYKLALELIASIN